MREVGVGMFLLGSKGKKVHSRGIGVVDTEMGGWRVVIVVEFLLLIISHGGRRVSERGRGGGGRRRRRREKREVRRGDFRYEKEYGI